jgi:site-specific DNA-methyltransferase (adenine-specific)
MTKLPLNTVVHGDCLEVLKSFPDDSVDSVVTDPPAGISFMGKDFDNPDTYGVEGHTTRDKFIAWLTLVMKECLRVLKPGGHMLVWSIPRTSHWTATAVENAGFEVRDCIHHLKDRNPEMRSFLESLTPEQLELLYRSAPTDGAVMHLFGQGFPKSLNISKAIDKMKGAQRRVIKEGIGFDPSRQKANQFDSIIPSNVGINTASFKAKIGEVTEPATPEAKQWDGWGTQLKPAVEMWWLVRKPIAAKNTVDQVLKTGTGAMNIDCNRVAAADGNPSVLRRETARRTGTVPITGRTAAEAEAEGRIERRGSPEVYMEDRPSEALGRFPANLILSHSPGCVKFESDPPYFECVPGCPVAALDDQSGDRRSAGDYPSPASGRMGSTSFQPTQGQIYADAGGASRFFTNFEPDAPFLYTGKAAKKDKDAGLDEDVPGMMELRDDITEEERAFVLAELHAVGVEF